jgi:hypothetical protein
MAVASMFNGKHIYRLYSGDRELIRCPVCGKDTEHVFGWHEGRLFTCLTCHPEAEKEVPIDPGRVST